MARSGDGRIAGTLDSKGTLVVSSLDGSGDRRELPLPFVKDVVALDETGDRVAVSDRPGPTYVIDLADPLTDPVEIEAGADSDLRFSPDGSLLAVGTADGIEIYDAATGELVEDPLAFATSVTFHFIGERTLRAFAPNLGVVSIDLDAPSRIVRETEVPGWGVAGFLAPDLSKAVSFVPDGDTVAEVLFTEPTETAPTSRAIGPLNGERHSRPISNGRHVTADTGSLTYEEWNGTELIQTIDLTGNATRGFEIIIAPRVGRTRDILLIAEDGEQLLGAEVVVVDRSLGEVVFAGSERRINAVEFSSADENEFVVGDIDGLVRWVSLDKAATPADASSDESTTPSEVMVGAAVEAFAAMPDGSLTAIGDSSGTVTIVDADRQIVAELANDAPFPARMAFIGDGARLVVQSRDGSIVLWDVESASRIGELYRTDSLRGAFEVTPDESTIVVPTGSGITEISVDPVDWERIACESVNRRLTDVELQSVVPDATPIDDVCAANGSTD